MANTSLKSLELQDMWYKMDLKRIKDCRPSFTDIRSLTMHAWLNPQPRGFWENGSQFVPLEVPKIVSCLPGLEHLHLTVSGTVNKPVSMSGRTSAVPPVPFEASSLRRLVFYASAVSHVPTFDESAWPGDCFRRVLKSLIRDDATPALEAVMYLPCSSTVRTSAASQLAEDELAWSQRRNIYIYLSENDKECRI
jgi:hypothetical protein